MTQTTQNADLAQVIAEMEKVAAENPENVVAHHQLGLVYLRAGRADDAIVNSGGSTHTATSAWYTVDEYGVGVDDIYGDTVILAA